MLQLELLMLEDDGLALELDEELELDGVPLLDPDDELDELDGGGLTELEELEDEDGWEPVSATRKSSAISPSSSIFGFS